MLGLDGCRRDGDGRQLHTSGPDLTHSTGEAICAKGRAAPELVYHKHRLKRPLRRTRPKGDADPDGRKYHGTRRSIRSPNRWMLSISSGRVIRSPQRKNWSSSPPIGPTPPRYTDVQNPLSRDIGSWSLNKSDVIPASRNRSLLDARRFVCDGSPIISDEAGNQIKQDACMPFGSVVHILATDTARKRVRVDCHENGASDWWMRTSDLSVERPTYIYNQAEREAAHCSSAR
jgi:hypothetical protein